AARYVRSGSDDLIRYALAAARDARHMKIGGCPVCDEEVVPAPRDVWIDASFRDENRHVVDDDPFTRHAAGEDRVAGCHVLPHYEEHVPIGRYCGISLRLIRRRAYRRRYWSSAEKLCAVAATLDRMLS